MRCIIYFRDDSILNKKGIALDLEVSRILYPWIEDGTISLWDSDSVQIVPNGDAMITDDCIVIDKSLSVGGSLYYDLNNCPAVGCHFHAIVCDVELGE